jgi:hypothetical protein
MKLNRILCVAGLIVAGTAFGHGSGQSHVLFSFDGSIGVQPFRSAAGVPTLNTVAGVPPGGIPWGMTSFEAIIKTTGEIRGYGTGVLLLGGDGIGTRGGPRQVILSLFCRNEPVPPAVAGSLQATPFNSEPVDLDPDGDFVVRGKLTDAAGATPPLNCGNAIDNRPVLLVRAVTPANPSTGAPATPSAWFAAGVIDSKHGSRSRQ